MMLNNKVTVAVSFEYIMILYLSFAPLIVKQLSLVDRENISGCWKIKWDAQGHQANKSWTLAQTLVPTSYSSPFFTTT